MKASEIMKTHYDDTRTVAAPTRGSGRDGNHGA